MKHKLFFYTIVVFATLLFSSCGQKKKKTISETNIVTQEPSEKYPYLISCDLTKLKDTIDLPLSYFIENLEMVKLENRDEALIGNSFVTVSENYILIRNRKQVPYKLFDKAGKFITNIGSYGQGPDEYQNVYDDFLDEKNNRIYILPWQTNKVLVYDLEGNRYASIPLKYNVSKGKIYVNTSEQTLSVFLLPFGNIVAWTQDFAGNIKGEIPSKHLRVVPDFSNEVGATKNTGLFDCFLFTFSEQRPDTLYHYDIEKNKLDPKFTLDFKNQPWKIHWYSELPNHFTGSVTIEKKLSDNLSTTEYPARFIVEKETGKGVFYKLYNDFLGDIAIWDSFYNGYYVWNVEPSELKEKLNTQLKQSSDLNEEMRLKLQVIIDGIDENENNYIFYGKIKR